MRKAKTRRLEMEPYLRKHDPNIYRYCSEKDDKLAEHPERSTRIALLADLPPDYASGNRLLWLKKILFGASMIIYCGKPDYEPNIEPLKKIAPTELIQTREVLELNGYRLGFIYGNEMDGYPLTSSQLLDNLSQAVIEPFIEEDPLDAIIFGYGGKPHLEVQRVAWRPERLLGGKYYRPVVLICPGKPVKGQEQNGLVFINLGLQQLGVEFSLYPLPVHIPNGEETT